MNSEPGVPAPRAPIARPFEFFMLALMVLLAVGLMVTFHQNREIQKDQSASEIRGYKNRAVICDLFRGLGITEPVNCAEAVITPYRDTAVQPGSTAGARSSRQTYELLCFLAKSMGKSGNVPWVLPPAYCAAQ
jgi:hypothetical protein